MFSPTLPHLCADVRIHIFARAQNQYLFPGSIDNEAKRSRVLDDRGLCRWWKKVLSEAAPQEAKLFYLLPGYNYLESLPFVPADSTSRWTYGHPYSIVPSPLPVNLPQTLLSNLIPAFSDDPKSRFLTSLTSSPVAAAGEEGDYDDVYRKVESLLGSIGTLRRDQLERDLDQERMRLSAVKGGADEFWERMGFRQECMAGYVTGFFAAWFPKSLDDHPAGIQPPSSTPLPANVSATEASISPTPTPVEGALSRSAYVTLWSRFHNVDYSSLSKSASAHSLWLSDALAVVRREGFDVATVDVAEGLTRAKMVLPAATGAVESSKRPVEEVAKVTMLQPRKKHKKP